MPNYKKATAKAQEIIAELNLTDRPTNLSIILGAYDISLEKDVDNLQDEALLDPTGEKPIIKIKNDSKPVSRKIFSIAHELGHYFLHSHDKARPRINISSSEDIELETKVKKEETEANAFAVELLMPHKEVKKKIIQGYSIEQLAKHFGVSVQFAEFRYNNIVSVLY